jgi:SAM-dependent methyltransferase
MTSSDNSIFSLINLGTSFQEIFLEVCHTGFSVLGRFPDLSFHENNPYHYGSAYPPSYFCSYRYYTLKTLQIAQSLQANKILDVAGGTGFNAACLYEPGKRVVLNDLRNLEHEVQNFSTGERIETVWGNFFDLKPESIGKFDLVMACEVIEHIAHGDRFINHLKQFITPGGHLLLTTPNGSYFRSKLPTYSKIDDFNALESKQFKPDADGHLYLYTPDELQNLLKMFGFRDISINLSITPFLSGHMALRFLPSSQFLTPVYYRLDNWLQNLGNKANTKLCTQMIITATAG